VDAQHATGASEIWFRIRGSSCAEPYSAPRPVSIRNRLALAKFRARSYASLMAQLPKPELSRLRSEYESARRRYRPGQGGRFKAVAKAVAAGGARDPEAVAAAVGRAKYGPARMAQMAAAGRRRGA